MILIAKPEAAPAILLSKGKAARKKLCLSYSLHPQDYQQGNRTFTFSASIYGADTVKQALMLAQHDKCAFCESKIGTDGDVEHFRPKAGCRQGQRQPLIKPGYYWLAYDWSNLLLACPACNQRFKRNYFPLADPNRRARSHQDDISKEDPLFINPADLDRDPERHIAFRQEIPYAIDDNAPGKETILALGLGREILNERRRDRLKLLATLHDLLAFDGIAPTPKAQQAIDRAKVLLHQAVTSSAEFASMARCAAQSNFQIDF